MKNILIISFLLLGNLFAQLDTVKMSWPFQPFNSSHGISGGFAEFRNTLSSDHFHNAVDINEPDGSPCYPTLDGTVYSMEREGSNAYIRIATQVGNKWKHLTYLHIKPTPSINIGDAVKQGETVIGTVVSGMGHVHLIEREMLANINDYGFEINNLRKNGGLTPFVDNWAPIITTTSLKFYKNNSSEKLDANQLFGKVDIQIKIVGVHGTSSVESNNGIYIAGYRIWNDAKTEVVYEPDDSGVKYRFDWKPLNAYVHNAFVKNVATLSNPVYWLTNGDGADVINSSKVVSDNYFDASLLPSGNYQLEIFAEDTRDNKTNHFFPISIVDPKPAAPTLYALLNSDNKKGLNVIWKSNNESDIAGYRLYYSATSELSNWQLAADESQLTKEMNEYEITSPSEFKVPPSNSVYYFALTAVDNAGQESDFSNVYARSEFEDGDDYPKAVIVNAFTKKDGNGNATSHNFVVPYYASLSATKKIVVSSISNKVFLDDIRGVSLNDYDLVLWFTGDNTNHDLTIQAKEMSNIASFLENGGNFFISGSKIGYDLDERQNSFADTLFYYHYMKSKYVYVGDDAMKPAVGLGNTLFSGVELNFGKVVEEKYPDDIDPIYGGEILLDYSTKRADSTYRHAGVGYKGTFGSSSTNGAIVYIAFPFESVESLNEQEIFMNSLLQYFGIITSVDKNISELPIEFNLSQNYPNPFNPSTTIKYSIPLNVKGETANVKLIVYDILGREVATLVNKEQKSGNYSIKFNASHLSSGLYFYRLQYGGLVKTRKMLLIK